MLYSRRNIRIKVMQALYAATQNTDIDFRIQLKNLRTTITVTDKVLYFNIYFLTRVAAYCLDDLQNQRTKQLQQNRRQQVSTTLYENELMQELMNVEVLKNFVEKHKLASLVDQDLVRKLYMDLIADEQYQQFIAIENPDRVTVSKMLIHLYHNIMYNNETFDFVVEELYPSWADEHTFILRRVEEILQSGQIEVNDIEANEANEFSDKLFQITVDNDAEFSSLIHPKLKGWDADRIAQIDMIVMKMCLAELLYFPNIPIKVSINEYIDISKLYSTPKSKDFVNGVIDKIKNELLAENKIKKQGRGLVND